MDACPGGIAICNKISDRNHYSLLLCNVGWKTGDSSRSWRIAHIVESTFADRRTWYGSPLSLVSPRNILGFANNNIESHALLLLSFIRNVIFQYREACDQAAIELQYKTSKLLTIPTTITPSYYTTNMPLLHHAFYPLPSGHEPRTRSLNCTSHWSTSATLCIQDSTP